MSSVRTTIDINDALLDELRNRARERKRPLKAVVEETLRRGLAGSGTKRSPVRITTFEVGLKSAYRGMSLNQLYDQIEAEDHPRVAES